MTNPIQVLENLNERWPNFFNIIKATNGFEVEGVGYEEMMDLNKAIVEDQEGIEMAMRAFFAINSSGDPEHLEWLQANGFISKEAIELKKKLEELEASLLCADNSETDTADVLEELKSLRARAEHLGARGASNVARGIGGINGLID